MEIASDKTKLDTGLNAAKAQITEFSGKANSLLGAIGIGLSGAAAVKFLADMSEKGGTLIETMNKTKEVFKDSAGTITAMAEDMANKFGNVKTETLDAAAAIGLIAQGAGLTDKASAELSKTLVKLADDASSFYDTPFAEALNKIRSGLVGESEPLRAFGVLLSEDAVKAKAMATHSNALGKELTEQEKVMARVKIITEGLAKAQGDHERTMGGYKNQMKLLTGEMENFKAAVGAGMAGAEAQFMVNVRDKGIMAAFGEHAAGLVGGPGPLEAQNPKLGKMFGGPNAFQKAVDVAAGVEHGLPASKAPSNPFLEQINAMKLRAEKDYYEKKPFEDRSGVSGMMANLGAFGVFGGQGGIAGNLNRAAMRGDLNKQIAAKEKDMRAWGGGHVMDTESFMRSAQERILQKEDPVAKEQLAELKKAREALDKLVGRQENKAKVGGMVLRGRES